MDKISVLSYIFLFFSCATAISCSILIAPIPHGTLSVIANYAGHVRPRYYCNRASGLHLDADKDNIRVVRGNWRSVCDFKITCHAGYWR